jgi:hypothetical protein
MLKIPKTLPVRTRLPLAAWAVAGLVALFSLMSTLVHAPHNAVPSAQQAAQVHHSVMAASAIR